MFRHYNAAVDLIQRNLDAGRGTKTAFVDDRGAHTYCDVAERVNRCANAVRDAGFEPEQRVVLCLLDTIDFPTCFLGAIRAGVVPVPVNTMCPAEDYAWVLADSRARGAVVSASRMPDFLDAARIAEWQGQIIVSGGAGGEFPALEQLLDAG